MPRFSEQFIQQVAQATDIVELIGQYVALKRRGKEFVGLCPFHDDHKPSMYVSPAKQIFKCFACGAGGGVYQFLMMYDKQEFPEAVRTLADRANIPLPAQTAEHPGEGKGLGKKELVSLTTFAARFFRSQLRSAVGAAVLEYARSRGLKDESIDRFGLGYAPDSWDALLTAARKEGFSEAQMVAAGLAVRRDQAAGGSGCYDRFRNRLMFPIFDPAGKVIAFGGRAMDDKEQAKYLNSPESVLFDKSACLYALNWARESIVSSGQAVVVEGYLDALIPLQAGLANVVATLGTAMTDRHVRLLSRYAKEAVVVFDADAAGQAAAERALEVFLAQQLHVRVATIPAGKDPCDYCLAEGPDALKALVAESPDALQYVWSRREEAWRAAGENLADRRRLVEEFLRLVVSSAAYGAIDGVREGQLAQHIGHMLNVSAIDLQQQMRRLARRTPRSSMSPAEAEASADNTPATTAERNLLEVLLNRPDLFETAAEQVNPEDFTGEELRSVAEVVWALGRAGKLTLEDVLASQPVRKQGGLIVDLLTSGERRGNYDQTLSGAVEHLLYCRNQLQVQELKQSGYTDQTLRQLGESFRRADVRRHPKIR